MKIAIRFFSGGMVLDDEINTYYCLQKLISESVCKKAVYAQQGQSRQELCKKSILFKLLVKKNGSRNSNGYAYMQNSARQFLVNSFVLFCARHNGHRACFRYRRREFVSHPGKMFRRNGQFLKFHLNQNLI
jgi:hypothetical protein